MAPMISPLLAMLQVWNACSPPLKQATHQTCAVCRWRQHRDLAASSPHILQCTQLAQGWINTYGKETAPFGSFCFIYQRRGVWRQRRRCVTRRNWGAVRLQDQPCKCVYTWCYGYRPAFAHVHILHSLLLADLSEFIAMVKYSSRQTCHSSNKLNDGMIQ